MKAPLSVVIETLLYLTNATRQEITHSVGQVGKYCSNPQTAQWRTVKLNVCLSKGDL
jgi:hypothetical protein